MVDEKWIQDKIIQLESDCSVGQWNEIRQHQLKYLRSIYTSGSFFQYSSEKITEELILIFHGFKTII